MSRTTRFDDAARAALAARFDHARAATRRLFDLLTPEAYYARPIALRNPIVFYEGHLPVFAVNTLLKRALGRPGIDERFERLFARGIDPEDVSQVGGEAAWPDRSAVLEYAAEADRRLGDALRHAELDRPGDALLDGAEAAYTAVEHEELHQETLHYIWHRLPLDQKQAPAGYAPRLEGAPPLHEPIEIPEGTATLGVSRDGAPFAWDNERPCHRVTAGAFTIDAHDVTNLDYLEFVDAGGYARPDLWSPEDWAWITRERIAHPLFWERHDGQWFWRAMFARVPLPGSWPVYVSHAEAEAYLRWRGRRLPTEAEYHRAAFGEPGGGERPLPWGAGLSEGAHGNFGGVHFDPVPAGSCPAGRSAFGVHDLVGNGWEWTGTPFAPFEGFRPMASYPEYSADFFDDRHFVMKGASPATPAATIRRSFRNWFRPHYPYVYATFRGVRA